VETGSDKTGDKASPRVGLNLTPSQGCDVENTMGGGNIQLGCWRSSKCPSRVERCGGTAGPRYCGICRNLETSDSALWLLREDTGGFVGGFFLM